MNSDIRDLHNRDLESIMVESLENASGRLFNDRYIGVVVDNNDPQQRARVKVRVQSIHTDDIPDDMLLWAYRGDVNGDVIIPKIGERVYVGFEGGNRYAPYWTDPFQPMSELPTSLAGDAIIDSKYPSTVVQQQDANHKVVYDQETGAYHFHNVRFGHLIIDKDGNVIIGDINNTREVNIQIGKVNANIGILDLPGNVTADPTASGPLCAIRVCPLNGLPHVGHISTTLKTNDKVESILSIVS